MRTYTLDTLHAELLRAVAADPLTEDEAVHWLLLLHTHTVRLRGRRLRDAPDAEGVVGLSWNGAASVVAGLWPDRQAAQADPAYWRWEAKVSRRFPERLPDAGPAARAQVHRLRDRLAAHPDVAEVSEDTDEP